jgi:hypothetical protein
MRVLITGSRDWTDWSFIWEVLNGTFPAEENNVIVSGACPTGADKMCEDWASTQPDEEVERHPADWKKYGRGAGPIRNTEMVRLGADLCIAFIKNNSKGASHTARIAQKAGIPTTIYTVGDDGTPT